MATDVKIPEVGESVTEVILLEWLKADGDRIEKDESIAVMESDKADFELPSPTSGVLKQLKKEGDTVSVGESVAQIHDATVARPKAEKTITTESDGKSKSDGAPPKEPDKKKVTETQTDIELSPAVRRLVEEHELDPALIAGTGRGGRLTKSDVVSYLESRSAKLDEAKETEEEEETAIAPRFEPSREGRMEAPELRDDFRALAAKDGAKRVPMSKIRRRIAHRMVNAQQTTASLSTFNEVDMNAVYNLREKFRNRFDEVHGVSLGLMSFFAKACVMALKEFPRLNASIDGDDVIYFDYVNLGIAVSTDRGLVVPVLRNVEEMSFAEIEIEIKRLAKAARAGKLNIQELSGGTFTITNGGIYGSMLSTPILNPPQSGILGMHAVRKRPVVMEDDRIEIHPMMYVALTYDHRLIDGRESVSYLVRIKNLIEEPERMLLQI